MFNSVLSSTPSDATGLTALALWILTCIIFVFIALVFYVVILINMRRLRKNARSQIASVLEDEMLRSDQNQMLPIHVNDVTDLDPLLFSIHTVAFAIFTITYIFVYIA